MWFSVISIFCLLSIKNIDSTVMLNCALGLVEEKQCPMDGGWSLWTTWSNCEGQCSSVGRQIRTRNCSNPPPSNNGADCVGSQFEIKGCGVPGCSYEQYEKLFAQDSNRLQQLKTLKQASGSQSALLTKCLLSHCSFETISQTLGNSGTQFWSALQCVKMNTGCPVSGGWGEWSDWSRCSALCGEGQQFRCHVCCDPPPTSAQINCQGESCEFQSCTGTQCGQAQKQEGAWSIWSEWSTCSAPCRLGLTRRSRICQKGDQKKAKKSLDPQVNNEDLTSFDYVDYYDSYFDDIYGQDEDSSNYKEEEPNQLSNLKKRAGKCDTKIEYYSTEDDEEYSITFSKSLTRTSTIQINTLTTNNLQTVQNLPEATQLLKHIDSTTSLEHLFSTSTKSTTIEPSTYTSEYKPTKKTLDDSQSHFNEHSANKAYSEPMSVTSRKPSKPSKEFEEQTKIVKDSQSHFIEHLNKVCSEPMSVASTKRSKQSKKCEKPHTKGKGKSGNNHSGCKSTTLLSVSTKLKTDGPIETCNSENNSAEEKYQIESNNLKETTVNRKIECTDEIQKEKEEAISMFGNIEIKEKFAKGHSKSDERNIEETESTVNEEKPEEFKNTIWTQRNSKTTCITIKPEDDIMNLGKESIVTIQPMKSLSQTLKYSITDIIGSSKFISSSLIPHNNLKNDRSNSNLPSASSSSMSSFERKDLKTTPVENKSTDEDLNFDNSSDILNQHSCDIKKILQLPSFNNSFIADNCKGPFEEIKPCNTKPCSEEGGWSSWSAWSPCSKECGLGKQVSTRSCTQPEPVKNGWPCKGETARKRFCYEQICPVKVATPRAMMMSGESYIEYGSLHQHSSVLLLYFRFQHFNCSGSLVVRKSFPNCEKDHKCDLFHISLYNCYILLVVRKQTCYTSLLSSTQLSIGDWHEILITIVGAIVTMRLDDSFITQSANLSCRPLAPNFDSKMKVGGHFISEIDQLRINFKNYHLQKKHTKRDIFSMSEENVDPEEISQVQFSLNKEETTTLSLALFIHAPCFVNESSWRVEVAVKPEFSEGLLLLFRGYSQGEFVKVTLEHTRVRLQVKVLSQSGECEQPTDIAPRTWIHVAISKPSAGPVGLAVNGDERCVVSLMTENNTEEPSVRCTAGIFLGELPTSIKTVLGNSTQESDYLNSPLGLLGSLTIDNHTLDLTQLPHKISSDISSNHSTKHYKSSSEMASITVHFEEMFVLEGEPFSLICLYDLSSEQAQNSSSSSWRSSDLSEYSASWIKLDLPVETAFETSGSNITYHIKDSGKSTILNVTHYADFKSIEGFYSCWLQYPLPLQPGLNIITYSVVVITDSQDISWWAKVFTVFSITVTLVFLLFCLFWIIIEAFFNIKEGAGFYRCKKMDHKEAKERVRKVIFSKQGTKLLGDAEAANESYQRCLTQMDAALLETEFEKTNQNELEPLVSDASDDGMSMDDVKIRIPDKSNLKGIKRPINTTVGYVTNDQRGNPFFTENKNCIETEKSSHLKIVKGKVFNPRKVSIDDLQRSEDEDMPSEDESGGGKDKIVLRNYSINDSAEFKKKEVGLIQQTPAFKSIANELKLKPEKFKFFDKYKNKGNK